ncbi:MAG: PKD domain-containing protein, partial [Bacteroidetes bacterium]|nr:PKD domain-containing protein [Bacteroidota bacterium]
VKLWSDSILPCEKPANMRVRVVVLGPDTTATEDKFQVLFPKGMLYDTASLKNIRNGPKSVSIKNVNGAQAVEWSLPSSVRPGDSIEFAFKYNTDGYYFGCGPFDLYGQSVVRQEVVCVKDNSKCKINVITGSTNIQPPLSKGQLSFSLGSISSKQIHNDSELVQMNYRITNSGVRISPSNPLIVRYHFDSDASGNLTPGDRLLGADTFTRSLQPGGVMNVVKSLRMKAGYSCALIAVLDSASCACSFKQLRFPVPPLSNAGPDRVLCQGDSLRLGQFKTTGFTYLWEPAAAVDDETLAMPRCLLINQSGLPETYPLYLITNRGRCITRDTMLVQVNPLPIISSRTKDTLVCKGRAVQLIASGKTAGGTVSFRWIPNVGLSDSTGSSVLAKPGVSTTYRVFAIDRNGCRRSDTSRINIMPYPKSRFTWKFTCEGSPLVVIDSSSISAGSIVTRYWKLAGKDTLNGLQHEVNMQGLLKQKVQLVSVSNIGCSDTFTADVDVKPRPRALFSVNPVCFGDSLLLRSRSSLSFGSLNTPLWLFGDGQKAQGVTVKHRYAFADTFRLSLVATSNLGCSDTLTQDAVVFPRPKAAYSVQSVCRGDTLYFRDRTLLKGDVVKSYYWLVDGKLVYRTANPATRSSREGFNRVYLHVRGSLGCADSLSDSVWVYPLPRPAFAVPVVCEGEYSRFKDSSTILAGRIAKRLWNLADGNTSTLIHPLHRYAVGGNYPVKLWEESEQGCRDSLTKTVVVHGAARPQISTADHCFKEYGRFTGIYSGNGNPAGWTWRFGDGDSSLSQNQLYRHKAPGTYRVDLRIRTDQNCIYDTFTTVRVNALPRVGFGFTNRCYDNKLSFSDTISLAGGIVRSIRWSFGDGDTAAIGYPTHAYPSAGTWRVSLIAVSDRGCMDSAVKTVATYDKVIPDFSADTVCFGNVTAFKDLSVSPGAAIARYYWDFNDGRTSSAKNPAYTYKREGVYLVKHSISTSYNCQYDTIKRVIVHPMPIAGFTTVPAEGATVLNPVISFFDISSGADSLWYSSGDGGIYRQRDFVHRYADSGWYRVVQYVANKEGCADTFSKPVYINFIYTMYLPDAFTPNRDGKNELFGPVGKGIESYEMKIYSRWGELMYETQNSEPWDGNFKGSPVPAGVYVVSLNLVDFKGARHWQQATFHLMR